VWCLHIHYFGNSTVLPFMNVAVNAAIVFSEVKSLDRMRRFCPGVLGALSVVSTN